MRADYPGSNGRIWPSYLKGSPGRCIFILFLCTPLMKIVTKHFDILKWKTTTQSIIQPHIQELLRQTVEEPEHCFYRGGFGRIEDYERLIRTGSDYENATITINGQVRAAVYASPFQRVGREPWCRGFDPLYWALSGHSYGSTWNLVNCIVAYHSSKMDSYQRSDIISFKSEKPSHLSIEAILILEFDKSVEKWGKIKVNSP